MYIILKEHKQQKCKLFINKEVPNSQDDRDCSLRSRAGIKLFYTGKLATQHRQYTYRADV